MELPARLRRAVDQVLEGVDLAELTHAAARLSERYRAETSDGTFHISSDLAAEAYLVTRLPATYAAVRDALSRAGVADGTPLRVAGNLPYNVASPILFKLIDLVDEGLPLTDAVVMLQREVADRLIAAPGTKEYGVLSVLIRHRAEVEQLLALPAGAFRPQPKVQSAVVRLRFHPPQPVPRHPDVFEQMTKAVFTRRRKTLANALQAYAATGVDEALRHAGIDGRRRPETLDIPELVALADAFGG